MVEKNFYREIYTKFLRGQLTNLKTIEISKHCHKRGGYPTVLDCKIENNILLRYQKLIKLINVLNLRHRRIIVTPYFFKKLRNYSKICFSDK